MLTVAGGILLAIAIIYGIGFAVLGIANLIFRDRPTNRRRSHVFLVFGLLFLLAVIGEVIQGCPSFR